MGTLPTRKSGGSTAICVYVTGNGAPDVIFQRLLELHEQGAWRDYTELCCAGNNNPVITNKDVYSMWLAVTPTWTRGNMRGSFLLTKARVVLCSVAATGPGRI